MPSEAVLSALQAVLNVIAPLRLRAALLGGLALAVWKHVRFTKDVDILIVLGEVELGKLLSALSQAGFRHKQEDGTVRLGDLEILQILYAPPGALIDVQVDLLLADDEYQRAAVDRTVTVDVEGIDTPVDVLACEDLIIHKLLAGRMIDLADSVALLKANRGLLDFSYMIRWIEAKRIAKEFCQVWSEAFPGEPLPGEED